ncbi:nucleoid occlusion factor SlmA [Alkalimarinus sediminis]|uniref:Nucleoid occlusion factor SlmA n=1 Tax=Alkalimarinus sediminis TaxID=1632866 RepID=A0A9E8KPP3_9ALTE|nr:nucleoid occlusion factor SlmA [Alkalimarinus sediminis]UZW74390.1 nucleoid occlusion factor SlmA [Alkalimarinus sediminis]
MAASPNKDRNNRRQQILESLALMLEQSPGARITTAKLAKEVGVTEAALYRHFPSKGKMFEGLIEFVEDSVFSRINRIMQEEATSQGKIEAILTLVLAFAEKNPGICRILMGDALAGEKDRLRTRVSQFFERLEAQIKRILREAAIREGKRSTIVASKAANLLVAVVEGRVHQFVRTEFKQSPLDGWNDQWEFLSNGLLV